MVHIGPSSSSPGRKDAVLFQNIRQMKDADAFRHKNMYFRMKSPDNTIRNTFTASLSEIKTAAWNIFLFCRQPRPHTGRGLLNPDECVCAWKGEGRRGRLPASAPGSSTLRKRDPE